MERGTFSVACVLILNVVRKNADSIKLLSYHPTPLRFGSDVQKIHIVIIQAHGNCYNKRRYIGSGVKAIYR